MALDFFIVLKREELDEWMKESGFYDRGFIRWVDGHIAHTSSGGQNEG